MNDFIYELKQTLSKRFEMLPWKTYKRSYQRLSPSIRLKAIRCGKIFVFIPGDWSPEPYRKYL